MSEVVRAFLQSWESELLTLRPNDPLINLLEDQYLGSVDSLFEEQKKSKQILKNFKRISRENGVLPLVQFEGLLLWQNGKKSLSTPLFLHECISFSEKSKTLEFSEQEFINPYLSIYCKQNGVVINEASSKSEIIAKLLHCGLFSHVEQITGLANLHPQRYELRKEWEGLDSARSFSEVLHQIVGDTDLPNLKSDVTWQRCQISPLDPDQSAAIDEIAQNSIVIYGPPGTGKTAVLSNVISTALSEKQQVLVVSNKAVALRVLQNKLKDADLDQFCVALYKQKNLPAFYRQLQSQFEKLLQADLATNKPTAPSPTFRASAYWEQKTALEKSASCTLEELFAIFDQRTVQTTAATKRWLNWLQSKDALGKISSKLTVLLPFLNQSWQTTSLAENLAKWQEWQAFKKQLGHFELQDVKQLKNLSELSLRCIQYQSTVYQQYSLLLDADIKKSVLRLATYQQIKKEQERLKQKLEIWKKIPTPSEWEVLQRDSNSNSWIARYKWKGLAKKWLRTKIVDLKNLEKDLQSYWRNLDKESQIEQYFAKYGVRNLATESIVLFTLLQNHQPGHWLWYRNLDSQSIEAYSKAHQNIHQLQRIHGQLFNDRAIDFNSLELAFAAAQTDLISQHSIIGTISSDLWPLAGQQQDLVQTMNAEFWADLRVNYPAIFNGSLKTFLSDLDKDLKVEEQIWKQNAAHIIAVQYANFNALQAVLDRPIHKLSAEEKARRQLLRKGKAILVKEMAKTRRHLPLHELFNGPAKEWLQVIFPIWLSSPEVLAGALPLEEGLFSIGIFDEASQLPLAHAVGALQRVKRLVVAGDPQQMRPNSYFSQSTEGVVDLLHQAAFHLKRCHLHHHYRSEDPILIAFSNKYFYQGKLIAWPAAVKPQSGLFDHYISEGIYTEQQNRKEAKAIALQLHQLLKLKQTLGVVAFSEKQLNCIYQQLDDADQLLLEERIGERSAYFLTLEEVQGEECDILLISFGYAKNETGQFSLKLGPMVQHQGARRLNVLLTRAKFALHFYSSIRATDFPDKRSEAAQLLWDWFVFLEKEHGSLPVEKSDLLLKSASNYATYLNYYRVLKQRRALNFPA